MRFLVVNSETGSIKEEHNDKHIADSHCKSLNKDEDIPIFYVQPTCPACYSDNVTKPDLYDNVWVCEDCGHKMEFK